MISGDRNSAFSVSRPRKLYFAIARPDGTASSVEIVAEKIASFSEFENDVMKSLCANTA
ncbi:hypothetical protein D9M70_589830 [compost metagenome]